MPVLIFILTIFSSLVLADGSDTKQNKKPSWSQGLPERKDTPNLFLPDTKTMQQNKSSEQVFGTDEETIEIKIDFGIEPIELINSNPPISKQLFTGETQSIDSHVPTSDNNLKTSDHQQNIETNPQAANPVIQEHVSEQTTASQEKMTSSSDYESMNLASAPTSNTYNWQINKQTRVEVPDMFLSTQKSALVKIFINNEGQVIGIEAVTPDTSPALINHVRRSVNRWRFASPKEQGNSASILSRVFKVELSAKT